MTIISDAPSCAIIYDCCSDNSGGVINVPRVVNYALRESL